MVKSRLKMGDFRYKYIYLVFIFTNNFLQIIRRLILRQYDTSIRGKPLLSTCESEATYDEILTNPPFFNYF
ncbi:hypothetical protein CISIN_1g036609mg [Citrus sinensis]|uniref:Uncharacterized protein n=1 Tax=Citrus sinensis TaxID=2711 RepID=A0A067GJ13_CITSI|nr:hypothetical protein CISIN_1g036609mg [Citrus sinensis]